MMDCKLLKDKFCVLVNIPPDSTSMYSNEFILKTIITEYHRRLNKEIRYPANWREAIKERFLPLWLRRYFPVKYKVYNVHAFYPELQESKLGRVEYGFLENT